MDAFPNCLVILWNKILCSKYKQNSVEFVKEISLSLVVADVCKFLIRSGKC